MANDNGNDMTKDVPAHSAAKTIARSAKKTIVLCAGGTGGHLFPAEALAQELLNRGHKVIILTDKRGHAFQSLGDKVDIQTVRAAALQSGIVSKVKAVSDMATGIFQARKLLKSYKPDLIVGFGGYPSFPGVFAGQHLGIPTILHEQNAVLGKANEWLADKAADIAMSLPATRGVKDKNKTKVVTTGNPVRKDIVDARETTYEAPTDTLRVFITGGSQGAKVFSDIVPDAVGQLPEELRKRLDIVHQCREDMIEVTRKKYDDLKIKAEIKPFFNDIAERLKTCHLFIGRSGASTVAEIAVTGKPAIFVPYPNHADMQQKHNAEVISEKGGAWMIMQQDFTAQALAAKLESFLKNPSLLTAAAEKSRDCGRPSAVKNLADVVEQRIGAIENKNKPAPKGMSK